MIQLYNSARKIEFLLLSLFPLDIYASSSSLESNLMNLRVRYKALLRLHPSRLLCALGDAIFPGKIWGLYPLVGRSVEQTRMQAHQCLERECPAAPRYISCLGIEFLSRSTLNRYKMKLISGLFLYAGPLQQDSIV